MPAEPFDGAVVAKGINGAKPANSVDGAMSANSVDGAKSAKSVCCNNHANLSNLLIYPTIQKKN